MDDAAKIAAEGKGYAEAAAKKESAGGKADARKLYLKAAKAFLEASKQTDVKRYYKERQFRKEMAETFLEKAEMLKEEKKPEKRLKEKKIGKKAKEEDVEAEGFIPIEKPDINFSHVGGMDSVKEDIRQAIVYPFERPEIYEMYGESAGEGILMYGPPGCGKTYIARAAAGECGASFLTIKTSDVLSSWVGESEKNIRGAFESAKNNAPSILFIDEVDAMGGKRSGSRSSYYKSLVNELLVQLDGIEGPQERLLTLAATNEPWSVDPALRRPGRFSKLLYVPSPDFEARAAIFGLHTKDRPLSQEIDFNELSRMTEGYSSADIAQICKEAAKIPMAEALKGETPREVEMKDFQETIDKRKSSLIPWFKMAEKQIKKSGETEIFEELVKDIERYVG